jgi:hypothetical protein
MGRKIIIIIRRRMKTLIVKSLLASLYQREGIYPSLVKRGKGRFFNNHFL